MKKYEIIDSYNTEKTWLIKVYNCNHVYYNQSIKGLIFNSKYTKTTTKWLNHMLETNIDNM
jgi:hypothetical protein